MTTRHFAVAVTYDRLSMSASDVEEAIERMLGNRDIANVTAVVVGKATHDRLAALAELEQHDQDFDSGRFDAR